jgi:dephospho-CoA kinase
MDVMVVVNAPLEEPRPGDAARRRGRSRRAPAHGRPDSAGRKVKRADYVIENSGDLATLDGEVARLIEWLKMKSEVEKRGAESGE